MLLCKNLAYCHDNQLKQTLCGCDTWGVVVETGGGLYILTLCCAILSLLSYETSHISQHATTLLAFGVDEGDSLSGGSL